MIGKIFQKLSNYFHKNKKKSIIVSLFLFVAIVSGILVYFNGSVQQAPQVFPPGPQFSQIFSLTSDKISQSANIAVSLPPESIGEKGIENNVSFFPEIKGAWIKSDKPERILFKPSEKLKMGRYYTVTLKMDEKTIGSDFLIVDDPKVLTVFPKVDSEADEKSEITVMFNRPMVPITTLDVLYDLDIPVEIQPATEGKFKWIGSRTLQFIPEERLTRSSNYYVKVKKDFISLDGLSIAGFEHKFTTRVLRYQSTSQDVKIYNKPIAIAFNQPVDLRKTVSEITLKNSDSGAQTDFTAEYGFRTVYNKESKKNEKIVDESIILVYNKQDKFGREKLWDFNTGYSLKINKAYPQEGDIILNENREINIQVTDIVAYTSASSNRTSFSTPSFFDPQGKLLIEFYEEINLAKSKIIADKLAKIGYGEKCKEEDENLDYSGETECEKETDRKKIYLEFDYGKINYADKLKVTLAEIVNFENLKINTLPLENIISVIPKLEIKRTIPDKNQNNASLSEFVICSNSPLEAITKENIGSYLKVNLDFEFKYWRNPVLVPQDNRGYKCAPNEFENTIGYGLAPESSYSVEIKAVDHFGQEKTIKTEFKTGEMPSQNLEFYNLQNSYNITTPDKTTLTYATLNMDYADLNICKTDPENMLFYLEKGIYYSDSSYSASDCKKVIQKKIDLPKKYWARNYFKVDLKDYFDDVFGHYILTFSHPDYRYNWGNKGQRYSKTLLTVTNMGIVEKKVEMNDVYFSNNDSELTDKQKEKLKNVYWITGLKTLEPIKNAKVDLFELKGKSVDDGLKKSASYTSDNSGVTETNAINNLRGAIVYSGNDSAILSSGNKLQYAGSARSAQKIYLYTDRPIYKPGDEVNIKGLYRIGYDTDYEIFKEGKVLIEIYNSKNEKIFNEEVEVSDFGTFNTKMILDPKSPLGGFRIEAKGNEAHFDVQEYAPAPFKVETKTDKEEYISGDALNLDISADYYFGVPLETGEVEFSIESQNYYFDKYKDEYFNFGLPWYYCYDYCDYGDKFILRGKTKLDDSGKARISQVLDLNKLFKDQEDISSKIFVFNVTVKNSNGQAVSSQKSFIIHGGEYYLGLKSDKYFVGKNESFNVKVKSVNTQGKEMAVNSIDLKINKIEWVQNKRKEVDGGYYYNWEKKLTLVKQSKINTDSNGNWNGNFSLVEEGEYELAVSSVDGKNNKISGSYNIYVYGNAQVNVKRTNNEELEMITSKNDLRVGDEGEIIIKSPYKKAKALISIERGKIFEYKVVDINQNLYRYSFKVEENYMPNFFVTAILLSPDPEIKFGKLDFQVEREGKSLNISAKAKKTHYLPGEEVLLDFQSEDNLGNPVETEFSVAVADLSVLALKGNPKKNPLVFFYGGFPLVVSTSSNIKNILYEVDVANETKGGGGLSAEDLAKKKRGEFKDTAFWQAVLQTDKNGKAQAKFILPDNLTTWQVETVGISKDTKLGVGYNEFMARKNIMVVPLKPRFVVPGDEFYLGAKIFNQTDSSQKLEVSFLSETLSLKNDAPKKEVYIDAQQSKTVYFNLLADTTMQDGAHSFVLSAKNSQYEDTVENSIKITRNDTYEATATAGYSKNEAVNEFVYLPENVVKDKGELTVNTSATLSVFLSDGLNYLLSYPYGCSEQIASKLDSVAIVKKGLSLKNIGDKFKVKNIEFDGQKYTIDEVIEIGLVRIYASQKYDGGFGYYPQSKESNLYLTLHIANTFQSLKEAGYNVNEDSIKKTFGYINNKISYDVELQKDKDLVILAYGAMSKLKDYGKVSDGLTSYIKKLRNDKTFLNEEISNTSLTTLAVLLFQNQDKFGKEYKDEVFGILENRIDIDSRGAFLPPAKNIIWQYYATPIKDTAMLLDALVKDKRDNEILDRILRWILRSRSKDGAWGSTNNTITVIGALTDYLIWQRENESDFVLKVLLDGQEKGVFDYNAQTILDQNSLKIPVGEMKFGSLGALEFQKQNRNKLNNNFYYDVALKYFLPIDQIPPRDEGFTVTREFYNVDDKENKNPITEAKIGDVLRGHIKVFAPEPRNFVAIEDFIPAGTELVNFDLDTSDKSLLEKNESDSGYYGLDYGGYYDWRGEYYHNKQIWPDVKEVRDDRLFIFKERFPQGEFEYDYYVRVLIPGKFHHLPAVVSEMYFPENFGRTRGSYFKVK